MKAPLAQVIRPADPVWAYRLTTRDQNGVPEECGGCHAPSLGREFPSIPLLAPLAAFFLLLSFCQFEPGFKQRCLTLAILTRGTSEPVLASSTLASYLIRDPASFYTQSSFSTDKGRDWLIGSISIVGSIHSSFLWNSALYLSLLLQCFFRNSISEPVR